MKGLGLTILLGLVACGKVEMQAGKDSTLGQLRPTGTKEALTQQQRNSLASICQAINRKSTLLQGSLPSTPFVFDVTSTDCEGTEKKSEIVTALEFTGLGFIFRSSGGTAFPFAVETTGAGSLAAICQNQQAINESPIPAGSGEVIYVNTNCSSKTNEHCIQLESASLQNQYYRVHSVERIHFYTNPDPGLPQSQLIGFYTERSFSSFGFCPNGKTTSTQVVLKR